MTCRLCLIAVAILVSCGTRSTPNPQQVAQSTAAKPLTPSEYCTEWGRLLKSCGDGGSESLATCVERVASCTDAQMVQLADVLACVRGAPLVNDCPDVTPCVPEGLACGPVN